MAENQAPAPEAGTAAAAAPAAPVNTLPTVPPEIQKTTRLYEIMLLFEPTEASRTLHQLQEWAKQMFGEKYSGFMMKIDPWAESRKLSYEVRGMRRGTYLIVYVRLKPSAIASIENDLRLDEKVMRFMVITHEKDPDSLTGRVRERAPDEFEDDDYRRRDDYGYDDDYDDDY
jgi:small subunit ribosomal protein S6